MESSELYISSLSDYFTNLYEIPLSYYTTVHPTFNLSKKVRLNFVFNLNNLENFKIDPCYEFHPKVDHIYVVRFMQSCNMHMQLHFIKMLLYHILMQLHYLTNHPSVP